MNRVKLIIVSWLELPLYISNICVALVQIYGEINRIRLILGENNKRAEVIEDFDKKENRYYPFFDRAENHEAFHGMKGKY